jgi:hypothetical protein
MKCFAYGSNLCKGRLIERVPGATFEVVARLPEHQLRFHKRSVDGSGKCDAFRTGDPANEVWGVIVDVPDTERRSLDRAEGLGKGYECRTVEVFDDAGASHTTVAYVAQPSHIDADLEPYDWYLQLVVDGARVRGLPQQYVHEIEQTQSKPDVGVSVGRPSGPLEC